MADKGIWRAAAIGVLCAVLVAWNWQGLLEPSHRAFALLLLVAALSFALFYELSVRDMPVEFILAGVCAVVVGGALAWFGLGALYPFLPNDRTALLAGREQTGDLPCSLPPGALTIALGQSRVAGNRAGATIPFRTGTCPGPSIRATAQGLLVNTVGYDSDGTAVFQVRDNQFILLANDNVHVQRPDRSTLGVYDRADHEVLYVRFLNPSTVRIRGRFLCGDAPPLIVTDTSIVKGSVGLSPPRCAREPLRF